FASALTCVLVAATLRSAVLRLRELGEARRTAETDLARTQRRLQLAQDIGGVGIWDWDLVADEGYWSDAVYRNHNLPLAHRADMAALVDNVHPDDRERLRAFNHSATTGRM